MREVDGGSTWIIAIYFLWEEAPSRWEDSLGNSSSAGLLVCSDFLLYMTPIYPFAGYRIDGCRSLPSRWLIHACIAISPSTAGSPSTFLFSLTISLLRVLCFHCQSYATICHSKF